MPTHSLRPLVLLALVAGLAVAHAALPPPPAEAGVYTVHSCRTPAGTAAGTSDWSLIRIRSTSGTLSSSCPNGPLVLQLKPHASHQPGDSVRAVFRAPPYTQIAGYMIWRSLRLGSRYNYWRWDLGTTGTPETCHSTTSGSPCTKLGDPAKPLSGGNLIRSSARYGVTGIDFKLTCGEADDGGTWCPAANPAGVLSIHRADITLEDTHAPTLDAPPTGTLVDGSQLTGTHSLRVAASDRGGGVYRAQVEIDGRIVASQAIDSGGCREPFTTAKPCPSQAATQLLVDTTALPDGEHKLRVLVTDATGTNTTEWGPVRISTANGRCNPKPAIDAMRLSASFVGRRGVRLSRSGRTVKAAYGRKLAVRGRLRSAAGDPLVGARVCLAARADRDGAPLRFHGSATTDREGRFRLALPPGPSRRVFAVHRVAGGAVVAKLETRVPAPVSLRPSRKRLSNWQQVVLRGRLRHGPRPRRGVLVELQSYRPSGWVTFGTARTRPDGRYRFAYLFTQTTGVQRYMMRALVAKQANYPYARGTSKRISLTVSQW